MNDRTSTGMGSYFYNCSSTTLVATPLVLGLCWILQSAAKVWKNMPTDLPIRPKLVLDSIQHNTPIYYFGVGSNMSRTKLENRGNSGSKINVISMEPCIIQGHRLAFNLPGIPPSEPGMGSLEPLKNIDYDASDTIHNNHHRSKKGEGALLPYEKEECHGALIQLSSDDYEQVYKSEGGGRGVMQGYEEYVVTCIPYDKKKPAVQAVAYRVRKHSRLSKDALPSLRYMTILREGAKELGLQPCYQKWLQDHPVQTVSRVTKSIAMNNLCFAFGVVMQTKHFKYMYDVQKQMLFQVYIPSSHASWMKRTVSEIMSCIILLPGASIGLVHRHIMDMSGTKCMASSMYKKMATK